MRHQLSSSSSDCPRLVGRRPVGRARLDRVGAGSRHALPAGNDCGTRWHRAAGLDPGAHRARHGRPRHRHAGQRQGACLDRRAAHQGRGHAGGQWLLRSALLVHEQGRRRRRRRQPRGAVPGPASRASRARHLSSLRSPRHPRRPDLSRRRRQRLGRRAAAGDRRALRGDGPRPHVHPRRLRRRGAGPAGRARLRRGAADRQGADRAEPQLRHGEPQRQEGDLRRRSGPLAGAAAAAEGPGVAGVDHREVRPRHRRRPGRLDAAIGPRAVPQRRDSVRLSRRGRPRRLPQAHRHRRQDRRRLSSAAWRCS